MITDLEPDILECEVKWALESITTNKASGGLPAAGGAGTHTYPFKAEGLCGPLAKELL